ncbi:MAG: SH3 domain-containing protein [Pseudomonadota bacterium]
MTAKIKGAGQPKVATGRTATAPTRLARALAAAAGLALIAGCGTSGGFAGIGGKINYAEGSALSAEMSGRDVEALYDTFLEAMEQGAAGDAARWTGASASGAVTPGPRQVGNLLADPSALIDFRPGLFLSHAYETELGEYVVTRNSNVRFGPSTETRIAEQLDSGTGVEVIGRVVGEPWMLVAIDGEIRGFVYEKLMVRRPGLELDLAGGPTRRPHLCRAFEQTIRVAGRSDRWSGVACDKAGDKSSDGGDGWRLRRPEEGAPVRLY